MTTIKIKNIDQAWDERELGAETLCAPKNKEAR